MKGNNGPRIKPCSSQVRETVLKENIFNLTEKAQSDKYEENLSNAEPEKSPKQVKSLTRMMRVFFFPFW